MPQGSMNKGKEGYSAGPEVTPGQDAAGETGAETAVVGQGTTSKREYRPLWNNLVTMAGLFLTVVAIILLLTFALFTVVTPHPNPYVDIVGYLILPGLLVLGVLIIPFGILFKSWRQHRRDPAQPLAFRFPRVDLNDPVQRRVALPDTMRERFRARPKHQRPTPSDIRKNRETAVGGSMPTGRKATSPPQRSNPSAGFLTQILGQAAGFDGPEALQRHRDGPARGSDAYRRAGGEPEVFPTGPTVFRMAV